MGCGAFDAYMPYACQRIGRASGLIFVFTACAIPFSRSGERCFRVISTVCVCAIGGYMPAGRQGKRTAPFSFALPPLNYYGAGRCERIAVDRYPRRRHFWYTHGSV